MTKGKNHKYLRSKPASPKVSQPAQKSIDNDNVDDDEDEIKEKPKVKYQKQLKSNTLDKAMKKKVKIGKKIQLKQP